MVGHGCIQANQGQVRWQSPPRIVYHRWPCSCRSTIPPNVCSTQTVHYTSCMIFPNCVIHVTNICIHTHAHIYSMFSCGVQQVYSSAEAGLAAISDPADISLSCVGAPILSLGEWNIIPCVCVPIYIYI